MQISATLPAGFQFNGTARGADGETSFMIWTVRDSYTVQIADERWVQFSTGSWDEMQQANARLIAAAPDLLAELEKVTDHLAGVMGGPIMSRFVEFENGVESIPTIKAARAIIARAKGEPDAQT